MSRSETLSARALSGLVLLAALGCGPKLTPEEQVELIRSQYTAELKSLTVRQDPVTAGGDEGDGGLASPAVRTDVILDILISTTSQEYLPGITIDLQHVDAERKEKGRRTMWVDTRGLVRGGGTQVTAVLENIDYQTGDGFFVEVRTPVQAEERGEYREFAGR